MTTPFDPVAAAAADLELADHAYQLALANGDPAKVLHALSFWRSCMEDLNTVKRAQFKRTHKGRQWGSAS